RNRNSDIAILHACSHQGETKCIRAAIHSYRMFGVAEGAKSLLEVFHHRSADKSGRPQCLLEYFRELLLKLNVRSNEIKERNTGIRNAHFAASNFWSMYRSTLAGFPTTILLGGTSLVTTLPAPTIAFSPIVTFDKIVQPDPIDAPFLTYVLSTFQSASVWSWSPVVARGKESLMNATLCPMKTLSSMFTPSQTKVGLEILQRLPTFAFFWIWTNAPIWVSSPISQP